MAGRLVEGTDGRHRRGTPVTSAIDRLVDQVRSRISVIDVDRARALQATGALFVDTRPVAQRMEFGEIPGALAIERNHLEWRLDPTSDHRHPDVIGHDGPIVVYCQEGYSSSLAVGSLADLGMTDVHDLAGGFAAWAGAGLPVVRMPRP
jgi:rhodanese-related sulfurtransferase